MRRALGLCVSMMVGILPTLAFAHARFTDPLPRYDPPPPNSGGIKGAAAPCGMAKPATAAHTYVMGSTITVKINEVITHPGHYELWWSNAGDANFAVLPGQNNISNPTGLQDISVQLTLPNTATDNGTLQLIMVMTEDPANPVNYYSCADLKLSAVAVDMAGVRPPDLAAISDLSTPASIVDAGTADLSAATTDTSKKPNSASASLPGCSLAVGGSTNGAPLAFLFFAMLFAFKARRRI